MSRGRPGLLLIQKKFTKTEICFFVKILIFTFLLFFSGMSSGGQPNFAPPDPKLIKTESMTGTLKKDLNNNKPCKLR